ncbi:hypothetical protein PMIN04_011284 [Paraphaeosphaeria minitans]
MHGAIMQSSSGEVTTEAGAMRFNSPATNYAQVTMKVLQGSGCAHATEEVACLSSYDAIRSATDPGRTQVNFPVRDDIFLFTHTLPLSGPLAYPYNVPVMIGTNRDEVSYQITIVIFFRTPPHLAHPNHREKKVALFNATKRVRIWYWR